MWTARKIMATTKTLPFVHYAAGMVALLDSAVNAAERVGFSR